MSRDFKIQNICDHMIAREVALLDLNRKDISVKYPIASIGSVSLYSHNSLVNREDYILKTLETSQDKYPKRVIRMLKRIKSAFPLIEVSYSTFAERCPKCLGVNVLDDYILSSSGDIALVADEAYLVQQVEKYIVTKLGSNRFHNWMGTTLQNLAGSKVTDSDLIRSRIVDQVSSAIGKLVDVQSQLKSAGRVLSPGETYGTTRGINIIPSDDPTLFEVSVSFTAKSGKTIEYSQFLELNQFRQRLSI